jgi:hypothetical protein
VQVADHALFDRAAHHVERACKSSADLGDRPRLIARLGLERENAERLALGFSVFDCGG